MCVYVVCVLFWGGNSIQGSNVTLLREFGRQEVAIVARRRSIKSHKRTRDGSGNGSGVYIYMDEREREKRHNVVSCLFADV